MTNALVLKSWRRPVLMLSTILLVLVFLAALTRGSLAGDDEDAAQFVRSFGDQAIAMLSDPVLGPEDREREFRRLLTDGFHPELIGRFVLGRHWRRASDEERAEFQRLFEDYVVASYAQQLANYAGEQLVIQRGQVKGERGALVSSQITLTIATRDLAETAAYLTGAGVAYGWDDRRRILVSPLEATGVVVEFVME